MVADHRAGGILVLRGHTSEKLNRPCLREQHIAGYGVVGPTRVTHDGFGHSTAAAPGIRFLVNILLHTYAGVAAKAGRRFKSAHEGGKVSWNLAQGVTVEVIDVRQRHCG